LFSSPRCESLDPKDNPIKGINVRFHPTDGIVVLAFYDLRDVERAKACVEGRGIIKRVESDDGVLGEGEEEWEKGLTCQFITPRDFTTVSPTSKSMTQLTLPTQRIGRSSFVCETDGWFFLSMSSPTHGKSEKRLAPESLKNVLSSFGALSRFERVERAGDVDTDVQVGSF
jgi:hypothetical protein